VAPIDEKIREGHLRWFGQVQRREINTPIRRSELIQVEITKKDRERPKITLKKVLKKDMLIKNITESMTSNKIE
jgi:RNA-binding protein YhbY